MRCTSLATAQRTPPNWRGNEPCAALRAEERSPYGPGDDIWDGGHHLETQQSHQLGEKILVFPLSVCHSLLWHGVHGDLGFALRCGAFWCRLPALFAAPGRLTDGRRHHQP